MTWHLLCHLCVVMMTWQMPRHLYVVMMTWPAHPPPPYFFLYTINWSYFLCDFLCRNRSSTAFGPWELSNSIWSLAAAFYLGLGHHQFKMGISKSYALSGYSHFLVSPLALNTYPTKWVKSRTAGLGDFYGKGILVPQFHKSDCVHLKDNTTIGPEY